MHGVTGCTPDGLVNRCRNCSLPGEWEHGDNPIREYCTGCGTGLSAATMRGGIRHNVPNDGTWWCELCDQLDFEEYEKECDERDKHFFEANA